MAARANPFARVKNRVYTTLRITILYVATSYLKAEYTLPMQSWTHGDCCGSKCIKYESGPTFRILAKFESKSRSGYKFRIILYFKEKKFY